MAFPVMTLAFNILPSVARDFSFMIQSAGMTAASATIALMQVEVEMHAIFYATIGGAAGIAFGLQEVSHKRPHKLLRQRKADCCNECRCVLWEMKVVTRGHCFVPYEYFIRKCTETHSIWA